MINARQLLAFFAVSVSFAVGQQPTDDVAVGQEICTYGYIMDEYCIVSSVTDWWLASLFRLRFLLYILTEISLCYITLVCR